MNKYSATDRIRIPRNSIVGLTKEQSDLRHALIESATNTELEAPEEGVNLFVVSSGFVGFRIGESFWVDETNGQIVGRAGELIVSEETELRVIRQEEIDTEKKAVKASRAKAKPKA